MFAMGGIFGRFYGHILQLMLPQTDLYLEGYAMVGAVAFVSGTTQTISGAIIMIEMTGQINMIVPCLIAALAASSITKYRLLSLYDQGMVNKSLESFELLLHDSHKLHYAYEIMNTIASTTSSQLTSTITTNVITRLCSISELLKVMESNQKQYEFAVVDDVTTMKLIGSVSRHDIFNFLRILFEKNNLIAYLSSILTLDMDIYNIHIHRLDLKEKRNKLFSKNSILLTPYSSIIKPMVEKSNTYHNHGGDREDHHHDDDDDDQYRLRRNSHINSVIENTGISIPSDLSSSDNFLRDDEVDDEVINPLQQPEITPQQEQQYHNLHHHDQLTKLTTEITVKAKELQLKTIQKIKEATEKLNFTTINNIKNSNIDDTLDKYNKDHLEVLLNKKINVTKQSLIHINFFPSIVQHYTSIEDIYILFEMVHVQCLFVTNDDKILEGMIDKEHLLKILRSSEKQ
jgi:hypothetical protein